MTLNTYPPIATTSFNYSSIPPTNASSVLLDGKLVVSGTYTTTITGIGDPVYLYANVNTVSFSLSGTMGGNYTVSGGSIATTAALSGYIGVVISTTTLPATFGIYNSSTITS